MTRVQGPGVRECWTLVIAASGQRPCAIGRRGGLGGRHVTSAEELSRQESLRLLGSVPFGRIVFTMHALPAIRPVNHVLHNGDVIIRTHHGASLLSAVGVVVAYEADAIDPAEHLGWSVIVTGIATSVGEPDRTRYERLLRPWADGHKDQIIRIEPELVTGFELVPGPLLVPHRPTDQP